VKKMFLLLVSEKKELMRGKPNGRIFIEKKNLVIEKKAPAENAGNFFFAISKGIGID